MPTTVYLISGANRGIGLGLVKALMKRNDTIVFAGARDLTRVTELEALMGEFSEKLYIVKLISADEISNKAAIEEIKAKAGRLDVVIANAGISKHADSALEASVQMMRDHYEINCIGPLVLLQASYSLLAASTSAPKFAVISSRTGSIALGAAIHEAILPYAASKAAVNYLTRKLHFEHDSLIIFPVCPGPVDTDMLAPYKHHEVYKQMGLLSADEAAGKLLLVIDNASRLEDGPVFYTLDASYASVI